MRDELRRLATILLLMAIDLAVIGGTALFAFNLVRPCLEVAARLGML